jgi:hypothetical protein
VDGYMNIALEGAKEYVDGRMNREYGDAFIRGNNGKCLYSTMSCQDSNINSHVHCRSWRVIDKSPKDAEKGHLAGELKTNQKCMNSRYDSSQ